MKEPLSQHSMAPNPPDYFNLAGVAFHAALGAASRRNDVHEKMARVADAERRLEVAMAMRSAAGKQLGRVLKRDAKRQARRVDQL